MTNYKKLHSFVAENKNRGRRFVKILTGISMFLIQFVASYVLSSNIACE